MKHLIFSYGTLQFPKVQIDTYGKLLNGTPDKLFHFKIVQLKITDPKVLASSKRQFHPIAIKSTVPTDFIEGVIFEISEEELKQTDMYEVDDYKRVLEKFDSGKKAWVYIQK